MSQRLIGASADLARLVNEGFDLSIEAGYLVVHGVPFLDRVGRIGRGVLACALELSGEVTVPPSNHVAYFGGGTPCDTSGRTLAMLHGREPRRLSPDLQVEHLCSSQPGRGEYPDYHAKVTTYVAQIEAPAQSRDPSVGARRSGIVPRADEWSPFRYVDTATSRAGIGEFSAKLKRHQVAIVGLGGSGSYILDLVSKTPVGRIHLFDDDVFEQHSAFRSPGAASSQDVAGRPFKVDHLARTYSRMHRGIVPHRVRLDGRSVALLGRMDFVFLAVDSAASRALIVRFLEEADRPFIDVGMGLHVSENGILGTVRVTTSTSAMREHVSERGRIPLDEHGGKDPYSTNVQIADLNCLSAALAVIRWKRLCGFYADFEREHWSAYSVDGNTLLNDERPEGAQA